VLKEYYSTREGVNINRKELEITYVKEATEDLICKIAQSGNRHWWIYHKNSFSGANTANSVAKDTKQKVEIDPLDFIKEEDLFKNPELMLWKVVKNSFDAREEITGHRLSKGDVIKIGRVRFKIKDITTPTYRKIEQKQKQMSKIYLQKIKMEMQALLQG
jgi:hypothetical protein